MSIAPPRPPGVPLEANWIPDDQEWELATRDLEGRRQGPVRRWSFNGTKKSDYEFNDDRIHGPFRRWHDSGEPAREGVAVAGRVHGWDRWYRSSGPTSESPFRRDIHPAVGRADYLYEKGEAIRSRYFLNDGTECEISGEPFPARPAEATPDDDLTWSPGLEAWYSELSDGNGIERNWSREGKLIKSSECVNGKRHGKTVLYRDDRLRKTHQVFDHPAFAVGAVVRVEGRFTNGTPVGWDFFDAREERVDFAAEMVKQTEGRRIATKKRRLPA
jgi:antitoxin component YwqK of YwqJK toxin-antitoxin module